MYLQLSSCSVRETVLRGAEVKLDPRREVQRLADLKAINSLLSSIILLQLMTFLLLSCHCVFIAVLLTVLNHSRFPAGYGKTISHVVIGLKTAKGTKQLKLDPAIYESLQKEKVEVGDVIYIESNTGAVKVGTASSASLKALHLKTTNSRSGLTLPRSAGCGINRIARPSLHGRCVRTLRFIVSSPIAVGSWAKLRENLCRDS